MDDHSAFVDSNEKMSIDAIEQSLVDRADLILSSSKRLEDKMREMDTSSEKQILLVRNGFDGSIIPLNNELGNIGKNRQSYTACYMGTIGPWFDSDLIRRSLEVFDTLSYKLIGPIIDGAQILNDDRIEYVGPVPHDTLLQNTNDCDFFIMPFKVDDVVLSVDPVKMYEYVNFGKDIVCVRYPEVEQFSEYAELYNGFTEYCDAIDRVIARNNRKYSNEQRLDLLTTSSWSSRIEPVFKLSDNL